MRTLFAVLFFATPLAAEGWQRLNDAAIPEALTGRTLDYGSARQDFRASRRTLYDAGRPSWGYWEARGDQYCSQWPPVDGWACDDVVRSADGTEIKFIGESGNAARGRYVD